MPLRGRPRRSDSSTGEEVSPSSVKKITNKDDESHRKDNDEFSFKFSSQAPEQSQPIFPARANEKGNLQRMGIEARQKAVTDLSRLLLFKALAGEPIDRLKACKEAGLSDKKISSAAFQEAATRLEKVFGWELKRPPKFMEKILPPKYKDRYFLINTAMADPAFSHQCKALHSVNVSSAIEKGLLMTVLAFCFCQGHPRHDGSRWILDVDLYRLLHGLDDNIPADPPTLRGKGASSATFTQTQSSANEGCDVALTPPVDFLLDKFVHLDYLIKGRVSEDEKMLHASMTLRAEEANYIYTMGPRAAMEIGRRQIISFCAEILDEEIPENMLKEIEDDHEEADDDEPMETAE